MSLIWSCHLFHWCSAQWVQSYQLGIAYFSFSCLICLGRHCSLKNVFHSSATVSILLFISFDHPYVSEISSNTERCFRNWTLIGTYQHPVIGRDEAFCLTGEHDVSRLQYILKNLHRYDFKRCLYQLKVGVAINSIQFVVACIEGMACMQLSPRYRWSSYSCLDTSLDYFELSEGAATILIDRPGKLGRFLANRFSCLSL